MPPPQPTTIHVHHQLLHPVSLLFLFFSFPFTIICIQSAFTGNTTSTHQALTQVSFFLCSFSVYAHPHLHPMHLCAHVHQPSTSQQHICIHTSTGVTFHPYSFPFNFLSWTNHCLSLPFGCVDMLYPHLFFGCAKPVLYLCSPVSWLCLPVFGCACGSL